MNNSDKERDEKSGKLTDSVNQGRGAPLGNSLGVEGVIGPDGKVGLGVLINGLLLDVLLKDGDEKGGQGGEEDVKAGQDELLVEGLQHQKRDQLIVISIFF